MEARRFRLTLAFLQATLPAGAAVLDLGVPNTFGTWMEAAGYRVRNTSGADLDFHPEEASEAADAVTAFEIFEHLVNPFGVLRAIEAPRLFVTVPLKLWFAPAYWNEADARDRHYHEFEPRQLRMLLDKAGWKIVREEQWTGPVTGWGVRPLLRRFTPRWIAVECRRT